MYWYGKLRAHSFHYSYSIALNFHYPKIKRKFGLYGFIVDSKTLQYKLYGDIINSFKTQTFYDLKQNRGLTVGLFDIPTFKNQKVYNHSDEYFDRGLDSLKSELWKHGIKNSE